jgi:hypothetical protein
VKPLCFQSKCVGYVLVLVLNDTTVLCRRVVARTWDMSVQRSKSRVTSAVDFSHTHLIKAEEVLFVQVAMDNTAPKTTVPAHMASDKFIKQHYFPAGSDPQARLERIRVTAVSSSAAEHQELVIKTNFDAVHLALVKPLYRGRDGASAPALASSAALKRIIEISYKCIVEDGGTEITADDKSFLQEHIAEVPLCLAFKLNLLHALSDRHKVDSVRAAKRSLKNKKLEEKKTRPRLVVPEGFAGNPEEYHANFGALTKKGAPKAKPGRKSGTMIINGKAIAPTGSLPPTPMASSAHVGVVTPGSFASRGGTDGRCILVLEAELDECRRKLAESQEKEFSLEARVLELEALNASNIAAAEKKDAELRGELVSRKRLANSLLPVAQLTVAAMTTEGAFTEHSPLKLSRK